MVLPERFELSTSPLPRECSTPELRQHLVGAWSRPFCVFKTAVSRRKRLSRTTVPPGMKGLLPQASLGRKRLFEHAAIILRMTFRGNSHKLLDVKYWSFYEEFQGNGIEELVCFRVPKADKSLCFCPQISCSRGFGNSREPFYLRCVCWSCRRIHILCRGRWSPRYARMRN